MTTDSITTIAVDPARLTRGVWSHEMNRQIGEGDISASYSADTIAFKGRVRRPFSFRGALWVATGTGGRRGSGIEAYLLTELLHFVGEPMSYTERVKNGDAARNDPRGFYHGVIVSHGKREFVLTGPPVLFSKGPREQLDLFGS